MRRFPAETFPGRGWSEVGPWDTLQARATALSVFGDFLTIKNWRGCGG